MWNETIMLNTQYDFDYALKRLAMDPLNKIDLEKREVYIPIMLGQEKHIVTVRAEGSTTTPVFEISSVSEKRRQELFSIVYDLFQWDKKLNDVASHFKETNLEHLFREYPATPIVKEFNTYASLMKTIIHQQLNMKFAHTLTSRFVEAYGHCHQGVWFYPDPETVAAIPYESLRELQFSQRKAEYVIDTSRAIVNNELDLEELNNSPDEVVMETLVKLRGIGTWTAENWLLFALGRDDFLPMKDIGIQRALQRYFGTEQKPNNQEITVWSKGWTPYRSYATITLWRSIE